MAAVPFKSFNVPMREKFSSDSGDMSGGWQRFFQSIFERLSPLGIEKSQAIINNIGAITFASTAVATAPDTISYTSHGYYTGLPGKLTTTGALPAPLAVGTTYYVIVVDSNTIKLASTLANATAGTAIDITSQGSGNDTFTPYVEIAGLSFDYRETTSAFVEYLIQRVTTGAGATELLENGLFICTYRPTLNTWVISNVLVNSPNTSGVTFSITSDGKVTYVSSNVSGTASISRMFWRARTLGGKNKNFSTFSSGGR